MRVPPWYERLQAGSEPAARGNLMPVIEMLRLGCGEGGRLRLRRERGNRRDQSCVRSPRLHGAEIGNCHLFSVSPILCHLFSCHLFSWKPVRLRPDEWTGGDVWWLIHVAGDPASVARGIEELRTGAFQGRAVRTFAASPDGRMRVATVGEMASAMGGAE